MENENITILVEEDTVESIKECYQHELHEALKVILRCGDSIAYQWVFSNYPMWFHNQRADNL